MNLGEGESCDHGPLAMGVSRCDASGGSDGNAVADKMEQAQCSSWRKAASLVRLRKQQQTLSCQLAMINLICQLVRRGAQCSII